MSVVVMSASSTPRPLDPAIRSVDRRPQLLDAEIPALCGFPAGRLVNGELRVEEVPPDSFMGARLASQVEGDVDGDGVPEVAAEFICSGGGDVFWQAVAVFRNDLTPVGAFDVEEMAIPGFEWTSAAIETLTWEAGRFRIDATFSASASDRRSTSAWLGVVDGVLHPSLAGEAPGPVGGEAPVSSGLWTFEGDWLDAVPQLGTEPVRGSGCGADGSIGDVIPDGWWFGMVTSDGAQFGFNLACAYYGESARPYLEECDPETCVWNESFVPVFFSLDVIWNVPTRPDIVKELTAACAANGPNSRNSFCATASTCSAGSTSPQAKPTTCATPARWAERAPDAEDASKQLGKPFSVQRLATIRSLAQALQSTRARPGPPISWSYDAGDTRDRAQRLQVAACCQLCPRHRSRYRRGRASTCGARIVL
jgi:hypothetical protein